MNQPKRYRIRTHPFSKVVELIEDENGEVVKYSEIVDLIHSVIDERERIENSEYAMAMGCE